MFALRMRWWSGTAEQNWPALLCPALPCPVLLYPTHRQCPLRAIHRTIAYLRKDQVSRTTPPRTRLIHILRTPTKLPVATGSASPFEIPAQDFQRPPLAKPPICSTAVVNMAEDSESRWPLSVVRSNLTAAASKCVPKTTADAPSRSICPWWIPQSRNDPVCVYDLPCHPIVRSFPFAHHARSPTRVGLYSRSYLPQRPIAIHWNQRAK
jgi:hypothetical protein